MAFLSLIDRSNPDPIQKTQKNTYMKHPNCYVTLEYLYNLSKKKYLEYLYTVTLMHHEDKTISMSCEYGEAGLQKLPHHGKFYTKTIWIVNQRPKQPEHQIWQLKVFERMLQQIPNRTFRDANPSSEMKSHLNS